MKKIIVLSIALLSVGSIWAQGYTTAVGVRLGKQMGVTVNQKIINKLSVEGILQHDSGNGGYAQFLVKRHTNVLTKGVSLYFGGGGHYGYGESHDGIKGVSGLAGIELSLFRLNVSLDYMPMFHLSHPDEQSTNSFQSAGAMSIRYILLKSNGQKRRQKARGKRKRSRHLNRAEKARDKQEW